MEQALTLKEVAKLLNLSYGTVFDKKHLWGAFKMEGSRVWRIYRSDLEKHCKRIENIRRSALSVDTGEQLCRSTNEKMFGGLILQPQTDKELDELLARL